jgi:subtilisin-like proprotein convertase family protein
LVNSSISIVTQELIMRILKTLLGLPLIAFAYVAAEGQMVIVNSTIPDNDANGLVSTLDVNTAVTPIQNVTVTLNISSATSDIAWNGDLYAYLTHDDGALSGFAVLLNRVGRTSSDAAGYGDPGFAITLSDTAANDVHLYQNVSSSFDSSGRLTGTWQPDERNISPTSSGSTFDSASRTANLGSFSGLNPNGLWVLFISDRAAGNVARLDSWQLNITPVPEPTYTAVLTGLCLLGTVTVRHWLASTRHPSPKLLRKRDL